MFDLSSFLSLSLILFLYFSVTFTSIVDEDEEKRFAFLSFFFFFFSIKLHWCLCARAKTEMHALSPKTERTSGRWICRWIWRETRRFLSKRTPIIELVRSVFGLSSSLRGLSSFPCLCQGCPHCGGSSPRLFSRIYLVSMLGTMLIVAFFSFSLLSLSPSIITFQSPRSSVSKPVTRVPVGVVGTSIFIMFNTKNSLERTRDTKDNICS